MEHATVHQKYTLNCERVSNFVSMLTISLNKCEAMYLKRKIWRKVRQLGGVVSSDDTQGKYIQQVLNPL